MTTTPKTHTPKAIKERGPPVIDEKELREAASKMGRDEKLTEFKAAEERLEKPRRLIYTGTDYQVRHAGLVVRGTEPLPVRGTKKLKKGDSLICRKIDADALVKKWPGLFRAATEKDS